MIVHPIAPVYDARSRVLILGSFPSVKSREQGFFYGHPQNRFWRVLPAVLDAPFPATVPERRAFLLERRIALWDVIAACDITGSGDASIRNAIPNDLMPVFAAAEIRAVFLNGRKAETLYRKWQEPATGRRAVALPSTSAANAGWSFSRLVDAWCAIRPFLEDGEKG